MQKVRPKKYLGQHFLNDKNIAIKIVDSLIAKNTDVVLEIGPGTGVLTELINSKFSDKKILLAEIDNESIAYLIEHKIAADTQFVGNFLRCDLSKLSSLKMAVIGNFPYNIGSQIFFKILENRNQVDECVCMIQKEVAERIASKEGNKTYGILSVLLQTFYDIDYLFTVGEKVFIPPPKVKSAVIRLSRNNRSNLGVDEKFFFKVVKLSFGMRRKTLRNALKSLDLPPDFAAQPVFGKRAEQLSVEDFIMLVKNIEKHC